MKENIWCLEDVNMYHILCPHKLKDFSKDHFKNYKNGDFIYLPGDISKSVFMISKGKVKIVTYNENGDEVVKAILGKGELFGEKAILGADERADYAIACTESTLLCPMDLPNMYDMMRKNEKFGLSIYKLIGLRIKKMERRFESLLFHDVRTRLCEFIKDLAIENGEKSADLICINHFYTQKDFADLIGTKRETVTRLFNELKQEGIIDYNRKQINVRCLDRL